MIIVNKLLKVKILVENDFLIYSKTINSVQVFTMHSNRTYMQQNAVFLANLDTAINKLSTFQEMFSIQITISGLKFITGHLMIMIVCNNFLVMAYKLYTLYISLLYCHMHMGI